MMLGSLRDAREKVEEALSSEGLVRIVVFRGSYKVKEGRGVCVVAGENVRACRTEPFLVHYDGDASLPGERTITYNEEFLKKAKSTGANAYILGEPSTMHIPDQAGEIFSANFPVALYTLAKGTKRKE